MKIKTIADLNAKREEAIAKMTKGDGGEELTRVVVGIATCGIAAGATPVLGAISDSVKRLKLDNISVTGTGCIGMCQYEPIVEITVPGQAKVTYVQMTPEKAKRVAEEHLVNGTPVAEFTVGALTE